MFCHCHIIISRSLRCKMRGKVERRGDFALEKMTTNKKAQQNNNNEIPFTKNVKIFAF